MARSVIILSLLLLLQLADVLCKPQEYNDDPVFENDDEIDVDDVDLRIFAYLNDIEPTSGLSQAMKDRALAMHNNLRRKEGASNMEPMAYSETLGSMAQQWAERCVFEHSGNGFGENIWAQSGAKVKIPDVAITAWFNEKSDYSYDSQECAPNKACGHYTQIVWHNTREVGCGYARCPALTGPGIDVPWTDADYVVCNYSPAGNIHGERLYKKGPACSECDSGQFYCKDRLCDSSCVGGQSGKCRCAAACGHGKASRDCKCKCDDGYMGVACNDECRDLNDKCGRNPGLPVEACDKNNFGGSMYQYTIENCPKLCKQFGGEAKTNTTVTGYTKNKALIRCK